MNPAPTLPPAQPPGMGVGDVYYILFRHKWKILICALLGFSGAAAMFFLLPKTYQSNARLFVRYVLTEGQAPDPTGETVNMKSPDLRGETIMTAEQDILTSFDLSEQVAEAIGPERILGELTGENDLGNAAGVIHTGLEVIVPRNSSVIHVGFRHSDPAVVQAILTEVINTYLRNHVEIHRSVGPIRNSLAQETDQLRTKLAQTEEELRRARNRAGIISTESAKEEFTRETSRIREELLRAQAELAERTSIVAGLAQQIQGASASPQEGVTPTPPPPEKVEEYRRALAWSEQLRAQERELLTHYTAENSRVRQVSEQLAAAEASRQKLLEEYPSFAQGAPGPSGPAAARPPGALDYETERVRIIGLQARITALNEQLEQVRNRAASVDQVEGVILELQRKRNLEEANYNYYAAHLEQSRMKEALGAGRVSNIIPIQHPSPPAPDRDKLMKLMAGIAGGGLVMGLGWAFAIEMFLDHSVRRPIDVERMLGLPLFLSIPVLGKKGRLRKALSRPKDVPRLSGPPGDSPPTEPVNGNNGHALVTSDAESTRLENATLLHSFHETLRDRLIGYFESRNLTHKPKLVAVTGLDLGAGVTTTAAGLASCLSETGEGNVLLVDMTAGQGSAQQFYRGKEVCGLEEILLARDSAQVQDNLFVVVEEPGKGDRLSRILPQRFSKLVPQLKASNFDYIIFDMPPVSQISITPRLAGFMDMVLLVIESEKTNRELVQRATALLAQSKAHVGAVLNKTKTYVPRKLHQDTLSNF